MKVVIFPEPGYEGQRLWAPEINDWHLPFSRVREILEAAGHSVESFPCDVDVKRDVGLYCGKPPYPCPTTDRSVCLQMEPPIVPGRARFYERIGGLPFTRILTFVQDVVDDVRVFHEVVPWMPYTGELSPVRDGYICAVSGGGKEFPSVTLWGKKFESLFPARRMAYLSFGKDLDLYGKGWGKDVEMINTVNYLGPCENKIKTMSRYKFAIVFENTDKTYTSEKYWDALQAGCEILYRGEWPKHTAEYADYRNWAKRIVGHVEAVACST